MVKKKKNWIVPVIIGTVVILLALAVGGLFYYTSVSKTRRALQRQMELGDKYLTDMDYEQAILAYEEAIKIDPKSVPAYLGLGKTYLAMADNYIEDGEIDEAVACLEDGISKMDEGYDNTGSDEIHQQKKKLKKKLDSITDDKDKSKEKQGEDSSEAGPDEDELKAVYEDILAFLNNPNGPKEEVGYLYDNWNNSSLKFMLAYIDNDDIPELIIDNAGYCIWVYYWDNGALKGGFCGSYGTWGNYYFYMEKTGYLVNHPYGYEYQEDGTLESYGTEYIPMTDSSVSSYREVNRIFRNNANDTEEDRGSHYYRNDVEISKDEYIAATDALGLNVGTEIQISEAGSSKQEVINQINQLMKK